MLIYYNVIGSPMGDILIAGHDQKLAGLWFVGQKYQAFPGDDWQKSSTHSLLKRVDKQIQQYYDGQRTSFDVELSLSNGTEFQRLIWAELQNIPFGQTVSYGELAERIDRPTAVRAVGAAVGKNPISLIVPCHRVVGANGSLTGYAGGVKRKQGLLRLESGIV